MLLSANKYINSAAYSALSSLAKMLPAALGTRYDPCAHSSFPMRLCALTYSAAGAVVSHASRLMASSVPLQQLTNNQLEIYRTPSTELWTPKSEEYVAQVVESQNIKKLKGKLSPPRSLIQFISPCVVCMNQRRMGLVRNTGQKMYDQADAAWEAEMRKKLGQDKKDKVHAASRAWSSP